jgi:hypothetical protein
VEKVDWLASKQASFPTIRRRGEIRPVFRLHRRPLQPRENVVGKSRNVAAISENRLFSD